MTNCIFKTSFGGFLFLFSISFLSSSVFAQFEQPQVLIKKQKEEIKVLDSMDGVWRGDAWMIMPTGEKDEFTQTERVGSMLDGAVKVVEGRGYDAEGNVVFNAFATIAYDGMKKELAMKSYAQGRVGDFTIVPNDKGYSWQIDAGPMKIRYTAEISDDKWFEYGERIVEGQDPIRFFEMDLKRVKDTDWPHEGAVPMATESSGSSKR